MKIPDTLETKRLILRRYTEDIYEDLYKLTQDEFIKNSLKITNAGYKSFLIVLLKSYVPSNLIISLVISKKETERFIGVCGLKFHPGNVECFYILHPLYHGSGFAIEALRRLLFYSFEELGIQKIVTHIHPQNSHAWKVAERTGLKYMGQVKHKDFIPYAMLFSIEKNEFESQSFY